MNTHTDLQVITVPAFADNYLWLFHSPDQQRAWAVDPGDAAPIEAALQAHDLTLAGILVTHHHPDHTAGIPALLENHPVPVYGPAGDSVPTVTHPLKDGDSVTLDHGLSFQVLTVPGHTLDHIAYFQQTPASEAPALFCGDTLFAGGCGRLFEGTPAQMHASLNRLAALPNATRVFCAHEYTLANLAFAKAVEPDNARLLERIEAAEATRAAGQPTVPTTLALEKSTNPFMRCHEPGIQRSAEAHSRQALTAETAVFAAVRAWKDSF